VANEYLLKEYELCFEQLRFYDARAESLLKYLCTLTSSITLALFAIYQLEHGATAGFYKCESFLCGLVSVATLLLILAMIQNRLYFVYVARQLNAIRGYLMKIAADGFEDNQMYTSTDFPALKPASVHSIQLLCAVLISSLFAGASVYGISAGSNQLINQYSLVAVVSIVFVAEVIVSFVSLKESKKTADSAIHHISAKG
jgi:hypothetical protein